MDATNETEKQEAQLTDDELTRVTAGQAEPTGLMDVVQQGGKRPTC
jgi:hypothetical protein